RMAQRGHFRWMSGLVRERGGLDSAPRPGGDLRLAGERGERRVYSCIVVGTDGSDTAAEAVRHAAELARIHGARLHVVSAYSHTLRAKLQAERELLPEEERWMASPGEQAERVLAEAA